MSSQTHHQLSEPSRGYGRVVGYTLVIIIAALLLIVLLTNPVLPL